MRNKLVCILLAFTGVFTACENQKGSEKQSAFSDIKIYFDNEINTLKKSDLSLSKNMFHEGKNEIVTLANPDWSHELIPFTESISDQQSQIQSYIKDSTIDGTSKVILFTAKDASAIISQLSIYIHEGKQDSIVIIKKVDNSYYSSFDTLSYYGGGNYKVKAVNIPGFGKKIGFVIEGKTLSKN